MSYLKYVGERLNGKLVQIYQGSDHEVITRGDFDENRNAIIEGKIVGYNDDCLEVEIETNAGIGIVFLNMYNIYSIMEKKNVNIRDIYQSDLVVNRRNLKYIKW